MRRLLLALVVGAGFAATAFGTILSISTGQAAWQVLIPGAGSSVSATLLTAGQQNGTWAPAPTGSAWISW